MLAGPWVPTPYCPDSLWDPPSLLLSGYWGSLSRVGWLGCDVDHSATLSAKVKNEWSCTSTPPVCHHGVDRNNFTFNTEVTYLSILTVLIQNNELGKMFKFVIAFNHQTSECAVTGIAHSCNSNIQQWWRVSVSVIMWTYIHIITSYFNFMLFDILRQACCNLVLVCAPPEDSRNCQNVVKSSASFDASVFRLK